MVFGRWDFRRCVFDRFPLFFLFPIQLSDCPPFLHISYFLDVPEQTLTFLPFLIKTESEFEDEADDDEYEEEEYEEDDEDDGGFGSPQEDGGGDEEGSDDDDE